MENHRDTVTYWQSSPIINASIVPLLEEYYPNLKAIGLDVISVTSLLDRDQGRKIHQALLGQGIRIFEDVALGHIKRELKEVIALPLMLEAADGAPVTMIGMLWSRASTILIVDGDYVVTEQYDQKIVWHDYADVDHDISIPNYIEQNDCTLKQKYLIG